MAKFLRLGDSANLHRSQFNVLPLMFLDLNQRNTFEQEGRKKKRRKVEIKTVDKLTEQVTEIR